MRTRAPSLLVRGALSTLYALVIFGLGLAGACWWAYNVVDERGYERGVAAEQANTAARIERKDAEMATLRREAAAARAALVEEKAAIERAWMQAAERIQSDLTRAQARIRAMEGDRAAAAADAVRMRDELTAAVAGRCRSAEGAGAAADNGAATVGGVLAEVLQHGKSCALDLEGVASDLRGLREYADAVSRPVAGEGVR